MLVAYEQPDPEKRSPFLPPRWFIRAAWAVHRALHAITGGRLGSGSRTETSYGTLRPHTTGRKSGRRRPAVAMLGYFEDGPNPFTLAMKRLGRPEPAWWLNLQASPDATIDLPDGHREIHARIATGDERARLWSEIERRNANLDGYAARRSRRPPWSRSSPDSTTGLTGQARFDARAPARHQR